MKVNAMNRLLLPLCLLLALEPLSASGANQADESQPIAPVATEDSGITRQPPTSEPPKRTPIPTRPLPSPTATQAIAAGDVYEPDSFGTAPAYSGRIARTFHTADDKDYFAFRMTAGLESRFYTSRLSGGADTELAIFTPDGRQLASDDNGGGGFTSMIKLTLEHDSKVIIEISNRSLAFGEETAYQFEIITVEEPATETPVETPTTQPTYTPYPTATIRPTYTPYPTPIQTPSPVATPQQAWPTATVTAIWNSPTPTASPTQSWPTATATMQPPTITPLPTGPWYTSTPVPSPTQAVALAVIQAKPTQTPTPATRRVRLELFVDSNGDGVMIDGEEVDGLLVQVMPLDHRWLIEDIVMQGELIVSVPDGIDSAEMILITIPYLHKTEQLDLTQSQRLAISIEPVTLPIILP